MTVPLRNRYKDQATQFVAEWTSVSRLMRRADAWRALCERAIDPNPFYAPEYLSACAALRGRDIRCIAVYRDGSRDSDLIGLFPLQRARIFDGALISALAFFRNDYVCLTSPLVDRDVAAAAWDCFFDRLAHTPGEPRILLSRQMRMTGAGFAVFQSALAQRDLASQCLETTERAALHKPPHFLDGLRRIPSGRRSDLRRRRRKMRTDGSAEMLLLNHGDPRMAGMVTEFLRLEASGWKGKAGTALACQAATDSFAKAVFNAPDAELQALMFNGYPIAISCNLVSQGVLFGVKQAYDESYAGYSPGLLSGLHVMRRLADAPELIRADSCAADDHVLNDIWTDRERIGSYAFAAAADVSRGRVEQLGRLVASARKLKSWLRETIARH